MCNKKMTESLRCALSRQMSLHCQGYAKHWLRTANLSDIITVFCFPHLDKKLLLAALLQLAQLLLIPDFNKQ